jgi:cytochrome b involved in lipid metabolism
MTESKTENIHNPKVE